MCAHVSRNLCVQEAQYLSFGFGLEHVICEFEGSFKGCGGIILQRLLFT